MTRQAKYYQRNKKAGLVRISVWIREQDREALRQWLAERGLDQPSSRRKTRAPDDHPEFQF
jgi:hypothetical protein